MLNMIDYKTLQDDFFALEHMEAMEESAWVQFGFRASYESDKKNKNHVRFKISYSSERREIKIGYFYKNSISLQTSDKLREKQDEIVELIVKEVKNSSGKYIKV